MKTAMISALLATLVGCGVDSSRISEGSQITSPVSKIYHLGSVREVQFSPNGQHVAVVCEKNVDIYDFKSGMQVSTLKHNYVVRRAYFSSNGVNVLTTPEFNEKSAKIFDYKSGAIIAEISHDTGISEAAFSPDGSLVVTGSNDGVVKISEVRTKKTITSALGKHKITATSFSPDGKFVLFTTAAGLVNVVNAKTGARSINLSLNKEILSARFSRDGRFIAIGTRFGDKKAHIVDVETRSSIGGVAHNYDVGTVSFSPNGKFLLTHTLHGETLLSDVQSWKTFNSFQENKPKFSPDGTNILSILGKDINLRHTRSGEVVYNISASRKVKDAQFSPDGKFILTVLDDGTILVHKSS